MWAMKFLSKYQCIRPYMKYNVMRSILFQVELTSDELVQMIGWCAVVDVLGVPAVKSINKKLENEITKAVSIQDIKEFNESCEKYGRQLNIFA
jgi:hypothetical protein